VVNEQLGLDAMAVEQAVVAVLEQIVAVPARQADAAISDTASFRLADTLFAMFARAGEDGMTAEQIRPACAASPGEVTGNRLGDKPYQREYRASFTSCVSMLFVQRMLARGGPMNEQAEPGISGPTPADQSLNQCRLPYEPQSHHENL
jgi:hypothetical protein